MRGFIGLCLLLTGLSIGGYSHYPGPVHREASLAELTEIVTGAIHTPSELGSLARSANASELKSGRARRNKTGASHTTRAEKQPRDFFQRRGWFANSKLLATRQGSNIETAAHPELISPPTRIAANNRTKPRALAIEEPPKLIRPQQSTYTANTSGWRTAVVQVDAAPVARTGKRRRSLKPSTYAERWKLVKSLQAELKRVGCYWGKVDGVWGKRSKWAMADFMRSVNAALPTKDPDYIQLQLISSHNSKICGRGNNSEQIAAHIKPKVRQKPQWRTRVAHASDSTSGSRAYRVVTDALPANGHVPKNTRPKNTQVAVAQQRPQAPLPGRMAVGVLSGAPKLMVQPTRETRRAYVPSRPTTTPNSPPQRRLKISALTKPTPELDLEGQRAHVNDVDSVKKVNNPKHSRQVNPFVANRRSAAKARRAAALRKANAKKKRRRYYRRRYRRRSVQSLFTHPLGRR